MKIAYMLDHEKDLGEYSRVHIVGVFSTRELAEVALSDSKNLPGFRDAPEGFSISEITLNKDQWEGGFVYTTDYD